MTDTSTAEASTSTTNAGDQTTTETTTVDQTAAEGAQTTETKTAEPDKTAEPVVPEKYDLQMPEGVELDSVAADEFTVIAKELKLDNAQAQKLADVAANMQKRQAEAHAKTVETWVESVKADKEIGGDKLNENLAVARKAMETFGSPELKDVLNMTGFGNHPAIIKAFYKIGQAISSDQIVVGKPPAGTVDDVAKKMFPNMN